MKEKLEAIKEKALEQIKNSQQLESLNEVRISILGKKGELTSVLKSMKEVAPEDRPKVGQMVNEVRAEIEKLLEEKKVAFEKKLREEKMKAEHSKLPHGGFVIHSGETGDGNKQLIEYSLKLDSNPEFTASVLICLARACARFVENNEFGCKTILDIPPKYFSAKEDSELRSTLL